MIIITIALLYTIGIGMTIEAYINSKEILSSILIFILSPILIPILIGKFIMQKLNRE